MKKRAENRAEWKEKKKKAKIRHPGVNGVCLCVNDFGST